VKALFINGGLKMKDMIIQFFDKSAITNILQAVIIAIVLFLLTKAWKYFIKLINLYVNKIKKATQKSRGLKLNLRNRKIRYKNGTPNLADIKILMAKRKNGEELNDIELGLLKDIDISVQKMKKTIGDAQQEFATINTLRAEQFHRKTF